jgi:hypothetical protein
MKEKVLRKGGGLDYIHSWYLIWVKENIPIIVLKLVKPG